MNIFFHKFYITLHLHIIKGILILAEILLKINKKQKTLDCPLKKCYIIIIYISYLVLSF